MGEAEGGIGRFAWVVYVTCVYLMWLIKSASKWQNLASSSENVLLTEAM